MSGLTTKVPYDGEEVTRTIPTTRNPGTRKRRRELFIVRHAADLAAKDASAGVTRPEADRADEARKEYDRVVLHDPRVQAACDEIAPSSRAVDRADLDPRVELRAALTHPVMRWWRSWMLEPAPGRPGRRPNHSAALATVIEMATVNRRPEVRSAVYAAGDTMRAWAYDYPARTAHTESGLNKQISQMLRSRTPDAAVHANLELIRELAAARTPRGRLRHPNIGRYGVVDATLVPAPVSQVVPIDETRDILSNGLRNVGWIVYTDANGRPYKKCHGYKLVVISDLASTLPLAWTLMPANGNERDACRTVLADLFRAWPDCPMEYLVGDGLYLNDSDFNRDLLYQWAIHPVFPAAGRFGSEWAHAKTNGVPTCCGGKHMHRETLADFPDPATRNRRGIPRGTRVKAAGRIRWICPDDRGGSGAGCRKRETTYLDTNPRLYTSLPHEGPSSQAALRRALLLHRNSIEAIFANLQHLGVGGDKDQRPKWANDHEHSWLLSISLLMLTARRLAHETGAYKDAHEEAARLDLFRVPSREHPDAGPTAEQLSVVVTDRASTEGPHRPPVSWPTGGYWAELEWSLHLNEQRRADTAELAAARAAA